METYKIEIKETLSRIVKVKAKSVDDAVLMVKEMYEREEIVLSSDDFVMTEFDDCTE